MEATDFRLSNSKLRDWDELCPLVWKAKHIDKSIEFKTTEAMEWGNYFETLVIGSSIGGHVFSFEDSEFGDKMKKSVYRPRVEAQAKLAYHWLKKTLGGKILSRQEYIATEVRDAEGQSIPVEGTLDVRYRMPDGREAVIDLKFTADAENEFGTKFSWGSPERMDMSQVLHYGMLAHLQHGGDFPMLQYWVFDHSAAMKHALLAPQLHEFALEDHIARLSRVYNEITTSIAMDDWTPRNTYENCRNCPVKCPYERVMPDFYEFPIRQIIEE